MPKNTDDMEYIIRLLVDMLDNEHVCYNTIMLHLRNSNLCINCMQHFIRCVCTTPGALSTESDASSSVDSTYNSSEITTDTDD